MDAAEEGVLIVVPESTLTHSGYCTFRLAWGMVNDVSVSRGGWAMLFKSSAHLLLWAFGVLVFIVLGILAVDVGLVGSAAQKWLRDCVEFLRTHYGINSASIDLSLKVIGLAISAVLSTLGFLRILHYAEISLPQRINDFINLDDTQHLGTRATLMAPHATHALRDVPSPKITGGYWQKFSGFLGLDPTQREIRRLNSGLGALDNAIGTLSRKKQSCETQKATVHLLRGLKLATQAATITADNEAHRKKNLEALKEFEQVLKLNENDLDGLEQAARQSRLLNSEAPAVRHLKKMARAAAAVAKPVLQARATRFQAEIFDEHGTTVSLNSARALLEAAIRDLEAAIDPSPERDVELAVLYECLGATQTRREKYGKAERALAEADRRFRTLLAPTGSDGTLRVQKLRDQLAKDEQDGEEPDDDGDDSTGATGAVS